MGPLKIYWYGLSYLLGIGLGWLYLRRYVAVHKPGWSPGSVDDLVFFVALGAVFGGRLGYVIFYDLTGYVSDPLLIFAVWKGGMSFHGGMIGAGVAMWYFSARFKCSLLSVSDFAVPAVPIGLGLGRLANFVNQELWGTASELPWAVVFSVPQAEFVPRHPSQIYEALVEGLVLFGILAFLVRRPLVTGKITGAFLGLYGLFRFLVEFVREPDGHLGYIIADWLTMGQILSLPMVLVGVTLWFLSKSGESAEPQFNSNKNFK